MTYLARFAKAASVGLLGQIPVMGPVILEILRSIEQEASECRLIELVQEMASGRSPFETTAPKLIAAVLQAEAELESNLEATASPKNRFLYLAANEFASIERTYEIANTYGFLWRSFYNAIGNQIAGVGSIDVGDIIALGYRNSPGYFKILLPLVVTSASSHTIPIEDRKLQPFVFANNELSNLLLASDYRPDATLKRFVGLAVKPLYADILSQKASEVLGVTFPSPGINSIWNYNYQGSKAEIHPVVRDWIASL